MQDCCNSKTILLTNLPVFIYFPFAYQTTSLHLGLGRAAAPAPTIYSYLTTFICIAYINRVSSLICWLCL